MTRMVKCVKLDKESEGLAHVPYPGEPGRRIYFLDPDGHEIELVQY